MKDGLAARGPGDVFWAAIAGYPPKRRKRRTFIFPAKSSARIVSPSASPSMSSLRSGRPMPPASNAWALQSSGVAFGHVALKMVRRGAAAPRTKPSHRFHRRFIFGAGSPSPTRFGAVHSAFSVFSADFLRARPKKPDSSPARRTLRSTLVRGPPHCAADGTGAQTALRRREGSPAEREGPDEEDDGEDECRRQVHGRHGVPVLREHPRRHGKGCDPEDDQDPGHLPGGEAHGHASSVAVPIQERCGGGPDPILRRLPKGSAETAESADADSAEFLHYACTRVGGFGGFGGQT